MEARQLDTIERLEGVRSFVRERPDVPREIVEAGIMDRLDQVIADMRRVAEQEEDLDRQRPVERRDALREQLLKHHLEPIISLAPLIKEHWTSLEPATKFTPSSNEVKVDTQIRGIAACVEPYAEHFVKLGLRPTFLADMLAVSDQFMQAVTDIRMVKAIRSGATLEASQHEDEARLVIDGIHGLIKHHVAPNPQAKLEWNQLRRLPSHVSTGKRPALPPGTRRKALSAPKTLLPEGEAEVVEAEIEKEVEGGTSADQQDPGVSGI